MRQNVKAVDLSTSQAHLHSLTPEEQQILSKFQDKIPTASTTEIPDQLTEDLVMTAYAGVDGFNTVNMNTQLQQP